jgi:acyl-CoA synthetase (AMP-forming)/AMP-acid ligase II
VSNVYIHIGEMLARNSRMYPNDLALVERIPAEKKRFEITWKELDDRANRFSNVLSKKGIRKGDKVVHFMNNSIDWLAAYFGIVRTGAWVVPLNFRFTGEDVAFVVDVEAFVVPQKAWLRCNRSPDNLRLRELSEVGDVVLYLEPLIGTGLST